MQDRTGQQLGNYRLVRLLGQGGFAQVYLGEHIYLKTQAAIKVLPVELEDDGRRQFLDEAQTIARLVHPHIVRILDFGIEDNTNTPYLVMDYAPNGTLRQRYPKGTQLSLGTIVPYVNQLASALHYAHSQNVIHRDVKPGNILLGQQEHVFLSDFGIATIAHNTASQLTEDIVLGTIAYMAPEQIQGKPRPASDQYALGIVVYEWLCGDRPFHGSFTEIVAQQMSAEPQPLRERIPSISADVEEIVMTALAKNPKERFASVDMFAHALEQVYMTQQRAGYGQQQAIHRPMQPIQPVQPVVKPSQPSIPTNLPSAQQVVSSTAHGVRNRSRTSHSSTQANASVPSSAVPPTLYVGQLPQQSEGISEQSHTPFIEPRRRSRILGLRGSQFAGTLLCLFLLCGLIVLAGHSAAFPTVKDAAGLSILALVSLLTDVLFICCAAILGPIAGLLLGALGYLLGDFINTLTTSDYTLHPFSRYLLSALIGLLVGLLVSGTFGRHKIVRALSLIVIDIIGAIAIGIGIPLALPPSSLVSTVVAILLGLLLIPLVIQICKAIIGHR